MSQLGGGPTFQNHIQGTVGQFTTPAGKVNYLMTKARLGAEATDPERRLTQHLAPVREVIQAEELDFSQLLQRDLDDHRVAVNLVPYLLNPDWTGPAFFPPIVAIALPFLKQHPSSFPNLGLAQSVSDLGLTWSQQDAGQHLRTRRLLGANHDFNPVALGQLWWNSEFCRIVVVDGQHRAMALLAIDRTVRATWQDSGGARYRYFYESRIKEILKDSKNISLDDIEVPVTVLWFPDMFGSDKDPHKAARKLFVDVNKEARAPSESRLILLSDSELANILTRTTLTQLRNQATDEFLPLYCVEYDNPDTKTTQSARWSALTNIHVLKQMATRVVFGPPRYIKKVDTQMGKREPEEERNAFMRTQLSVDKLFPPTLPGDENFARDKLGNLSFPESAIAPLADAFEQSWGRALLTLLSETLPFKAHAEALTKLKESWLPDDTAATLAHDALFSGVGMFWTLRDSASYYQEERAVDSTAVKPDVVKAWDLIAKKQSEFEELRAQELLGSKSKRLAANQLYQAVNTHACQLGLALTLGTLHTLAREGDASVVAVAQRMVKAINAWMTSKTAGDYDRRVALAKRRDGFPKSPLNVIANMDAPRAIQFRYFWLEILASSQAAPELAGTLSSTVVGQHRDIARRAYLEYVTGEKEKALKTSAPGLTDAERKSQARSSAASELQMALLRWFGLTSSDWEAWKKTPAATAPPTPASSHAPSSDADADVSTVGEEMEDEADGESEETVSIEDLIAPDSE
ncbi:DNA sulfur modification protein DndB [Friedmanniella luteola]|uniref:DNA sulfur modification protein DndB n=1 Tax=Friedmanniella luteola TaxID=546871 RepID=UPI0018D368E7|nr:DNA sulfur modification protein DndB [Friedmanniella luteola]